MVIIPSKTRKIKTCIICEKEFTSCHPSAKSCSESCKRKRKQTIKQINRESAKTRYTPVKKTEKVCTICEETFLTSNNTKRTCSEVCSGALRTRTMENKPRKSRRGIAHAKIKIPEKFLVRGAIKYTGIKI